MNPATRLRKALGAASVLTVAATLLLGLWPYQPLSRNGVGTILQMLRGTQSFFPGNDVHWLETEPGLQFGEHGSIFSKSEFHSKGSKSGGAIEIWFQPATQKVEGTLLAFSKPEAPVQFRIRQVNTDLVLWHPSKPPENNEGQWLSVENVLHSQRKVLITISADESGTLVYLNGEPARRADWFWMSPSDLEGTLVIADSPEGHDQWMGLVSGLAMYDRALSARDVQAHLQDWQTAGRKLAGESHLTALYLFAEGQGNTVQCAVGGGPQLKIPKALKSLRPAFLTPFWKEFGAPWDYWSDVAVNIAGFMPLGIFLSLFLRLEGKGRPMATVLLVGFLLSLAIELGQYFLPLRSSGTTDLLTNTSGAALGALLGRSGAGRKILTRFEKAPKP